MAKIYGQTYRVITGISDDKVEASYEAGDVATLNRPWDVSWLLAIGAIEPVDSPSANETPIDEIETPAEEAPADVEEVANGDGEDE